MGSESDFLFFFCRVFFCLEVTLKSILCQSETPIIKKLLLIALTVRLWVIGRTALPVYPPQWRTPLFLSHFEGLKEYSCNHTAYLPGKIDSLLLSRMDEGKKSETGEFLSKICPKTVSFKFYENPSGVVNCVSVCVWDCIHTCEDMNPISLSRGGQTTLELYMHQSTDQILVVIVLMFVTCVLIIKHNVIYWNYM